MILLRPITCAIQTAHHRGGVQLGKGDIEDQVAEEDGQNLYNKN